MITRKRRLVLLALFTSGMAGLVHEIVWAKLLATLIGSTAHAQALVLAVFMGGLAIGSLIFGRRADRARRPLRTYVALEVVIGLYGLALPLLLLGLGAAYDRLGALFFESGGLRLAVRFLLALLALLPPAIMMGGTLPILARYLISDARQTRRAVASLYAVNNLGAVVGAGAAGFLVLGSFGTWAAVGLASVLNLVAGAMVLVCDRAAAASPGVPPPQATASPTHVSPADGDTYAPSQYRLTLFALLLSGFAAMGYEALMTRVIALAFGSSTYSFTVMLMSFIAGIGFGSAVASCLSIQRPLWWLALSQLAVVLSLVAVTPLLARLAYLSALWRLQVNAVGGSMALDHIGKAGLCLTILLVPTACLGMMLPLVAQVQARRLTAVASAIGSTYAWNTTGNVLGVLVTQLVLIPTAGVLGAFHLNLALNVAAAALLLLAAGGEATARRRLTAVAGTVSVLGVYGVLGSDWTQSVNLARNHLRLRSGPDPGQSEATRAVHPASGFAAWRRWYVLDQADVDEVFLDEDANTTVLAMRKEDEATLYVNTKPDASCAPRGTDLNTQMLLGHLPLFFSPDPRSVLVVGYGSGVTCGSVLLHPVERVDVVEISRGVLDAHRIFAPSSIPAGCSASGSTSMSRAMPR